MLTLVRQMDGGRLEIARKVWFDRADLRVSRVQLYGAAGRLDSDIEYSDWQPLGAAPTGGAPVLKQASYAHDIHIWRPQDDYKLEVQILKLTRNEESSPDPFELAPPAGAQI